MLPSIHVIEGVLAFCEAKWVDDWKWVETSLDRGVVARKMGFTASRLVAEQIAAEHWRALKAFQGA